MSDSFQPVAMSLLDDNAPASECCSSGDAVTAASGDAVIAASGDAVIAASGDADIAVIALILCLL